MNILIEKLKGFVQSLKNEGKTELVIINALKEQMQYLILDFIYNHTAYSHLVMYGGTLLRIGYGLPRMSEDLDFQTDATFDFEAFQKDLIAYCQSTYGATLEISTKTERLTGTDVAVIKFPFLKDLGAGHSWTTLKIRFDVNYFPQATLFDTETLPITKESYAFSIRTYSISTLMASKVAAVFLRTKRGIKDEMADCKPRDIYDLMWYMEQKIVPNVDYVRAKGIKTKNILDLFDALALRVLKLNDDLFRHDLVSFFYNPGDYDLWHRNWRERFKILRDGYQVHRVKDLLEAFLKVDYDTQNRHFIFRFMTDEPGGQVKFTCSLDEYWFRFSDLDISQGHRRKEIESKLVNPDKLKDLDYEYLGFFYTKIEDYLKRNDWIVTHNTLQTRLIRATGDKFHLKTQIFLDRKLLEKTAFENLM